MNETLPITDSRYPGFVEARRDMLRSCVGSRSLAREIGIICRGFGLTEDQYSAWAIQADTDEVEARHGRW